MKRQFKKASEKNFIEISTFHATDKKVKEIKAVFENLRKKRAKLELNYSDSESIELIHKANLIHHMLDAMDHFLANHFLPSEEMIDFLTMVIEETHRDILYIKKDCATHKKKGPGNPNFKELPMPDGFFKTANQLKKDHPEKSDSWIQLRLIQKFFNGDVSKRTTVYRRLKKYWK